MPARVTEKDQISINGNLFKTRGRVRERLASNQPGNSRSATTRSSRTRSRPSGASAMPVAASEWKCWTLAPIWTGCGGRRCS